MDVLVVGPPRLLREDFDEGLGDWTPNFFSSASHVGGMARFHNTQPSYFGILEYTTVHAVDWVYKGALGNATKNTAVGLFSYTGGDPGVYHIAIGASPPLDSVVGDSVAVANYQLRVYTSGWWSEGDWLGKSDAIAGVGELTEITLASWQGELTAWAGATELVKVDLAARGWASTMLRPALALWPTRFAVEEDGIADRVDLWGSEVNADADWHEGPPDIPGLPVIRTGIEMKSPGIRKK